jgi:[acyl-carrier-protein] S-malonyltransferase
VIVSGEKSKVTQAVAHAKERGMKKIIPLNVAGAYHSRQMEPARAQFAAYLAGIPFAPPRLGLFTNTTGLAVAEPEAIRAALAAQVVSAVHWETCMRSAAAAGATEFWELGPGGVLAGLARRIDKSWVVKSFSEWTELTA